MMEKSRYVCLMTQHGVIMTPGINSTGHTKSKYLNNYSNGYVTQDDQYHDMVQRKAIETYFAILLY